MRHLVSAVQRSLQLVVKIHVRPIMASVSECEPTAHKRPKLESDANEKQTTDEDNGWRSKLFRGYDEEHVGITEFIGNFKPFEGILKNR